MSYMEMTIGFWVSLVVSGICAYPILLTLKATKSRQVVSQYAPEGHAKKQGTPTMGGLIIAVGFIAAMSLLSLFNRSHDSPNLSLLLLFVLFSSIGFVDDFVVPRVFPGKRGLGWKQKFLMQAVAALVFAIPAFSSNWSLVMWSVFLIMFFSNAYNFSDGLDALAGSLLIAFAAGLIGIAVLAGSYELVPCLLALIGGTIAFLFLNAPPAKVFMGDVGSLGIGAVLGAVVLYTAAGARGVEFRSPFSSGYVGPQPIFLALFVASLMMVVELVPVPLQIASVKLRKKKLFPYTPIHHAFEKAGWPESRVVWMFALSQLILSVLAVQIAFTGSILGNNSLQWYRK
jgi:phospho-N-acetylmuramoyl-pentapeptide-transferase